MISCLYGTTTIILATFCLTLHEEFYTASFQLYGSETIIKLIRVIPEANTWKLGNPLRSAALNKLNVMSLDSPQKSYSWCEFRAHRKVKCSWENRSECSPPDGFIDSGFTSGSDVEQVFESETLSREAAKFNLVKEICHRRPSLRMLSSKDFVFHLLQKPSYYTG